MSYAEAVEDSILIHRGGKGLPSQRRTSPIWRNHTSPIRSWARSRTHKPKLCPWKRHMSKKEDFK